MFKPLLYALLLCLMAGSVYASCQWATKCGTGGCERVPVCDAISDFAPQKNTRNAMLLNRNSQPTPSSQCHQQKVCTKFGNCNFVNICQ